MTAMRKLFGGLALLALATLGADAQVRCGPAGNVPLCLGNNVVSTDSTPVAPKLEGTFEVYVATTGVDPAAPPAIGQCLQASPCATIARALLVVSEVDMNGFAAIVNIADGLYEFTTRWTKTPANAASGTVFIRGNCTSQATWDNVIISPPHGEGLGFGIAAPGANVQVECMKIQTSVADAGASAIRFHTRVRGSWKNIVFGAVGAAHVSCGEQALCTLAGSYVIEGNAAYHLQVDHDSTMVYIGPVFIEPPDPPAVPFTVELVGSRTFSSAFIHTERGAGLTGSQIVFVGSNPTGRQFIVESGSWFTPGFKHQTGPSVTLVYPGTLAGLVQSNGTYATTSDSQAAEVATFAVCPAATPNIGLQPNQEVAFTGNSCSISSFGPLGTGDAASPDISIGLTRVITYRGATYVNLQNNITNCGGPDPICAAALTIAGGRDLTLLPNDRIWARYMGGYVRNPAPPAGDGLVVSSGFWYVWQPEQAVGATPYPNLINNPQFDIWQRGTTFAIPSLTKTQTADGWFALRSGTGEVVSRQAGLNGAQYAMQFGRAPGDMNITGVRICYRVDDEIARFLSGRNYTLSWDSETGANFNGTTISVVAYYGSGSGDWDCASPGFGTTAGLSITNTGNINIGVNQAAGTNRRDRTITVVAATGGLTQMGIIWTFAPTNPSTAGADEWVRISRVKLEANSTESRYTAPTLAESLAQAKKRYQKSFLQATAPATNVGAGTGEFRVPATMTGAAAGTLGTVRFSPTMMLTTGGAVPTCTLYNPAAANAQIRNITDGADFTASAAANISQDGFEVTGTGSAGTAVGETLGIHWACSSAL